MWCQDEAGPYQTRAYDGQSWRTQGQPQKQDAEYVRAGTAKMLTLFQPSSGMVRAKGVERSTNAILHPWLKTELEAILAELSPPPERSLDETKLLWKSWQQDMTVKYTLLHNPVPLRLILVWDNLIGHHSGDIVLWLYQHGIMPLFTPIKGSWLNMRPGSRGCRFGQDRQKVYSVSWCVAHSTALIRPAHSKSSLRSRERLEAGTNNLPRSLGVGNVGRDGNVRV